MLNLALIPLRPVSRSALELTILVANDQFSVLGDDGSPSDIVLRLFDKGAVHILRLSLAQRW